MKQKITVLAVLLVLIWGVIFVSSLRGAAGTYPIANVLSSIAGKYTSVSAYDPTKSPAWLTYLVTFPGTASLKNMTPTFGYWIYINQTGGANLTINGTILSNTTWELQTGWNLVGYPQLTPQPVATALTSISGHYTSVSAYDPTKSPAWLTYLVAFPGTASLQNLTAGFGYWIYINGTSPINLTI